MRYPLSPYPSSWNHLPTKAVRLPEVFLPQILDYAHRLDQISPPHPFTLGIKPSIASTGWGIITSSDEQLVDYGTLETSASDPMSVRLKEIYDDLTDLLHQYHPHQVVIEQVYLNEDHPTANVKTLQCLGTLLCAVAQFDLIPKLVYAMQWKSQIEHPRASEDEIFDTLSGLFDLDIPRYHPGVSALGIALAKDI